MINPLFLPELREMLAEGNAAELREFCTALHPTRTVDFMEGLTAAETWQVLKNAEMPVRVEIFSYLDRGMQMEILHSQDRGEVAGLIAELPADDRVDVLAGVDQAVVDDILSRLPAAERRDILRLSAYPEGSAGGIMTTDFAALSETLTVRQALDELSQIAEGLETIYYIYTVDEAKRLRGTVSARELVSNLRRPQTTLADLMETDVIVVHVNEDQEEVARKVAHLDLLAIPVVDDQRRLLGIITHDDVIDVVREEATEDAQMIAAVSPLDDSYSRTPLFTLSWKRGLWLTILFFGALFTAFALQNYQTHLATWSWLVLFIPLIISTGGNTGSQSATLIITALSTGDITVSDWRRVFLRELVIGATMGAYLGLIGFAIALVAAPTWSAALVLPLTLQLVVLCGALAGCILPLLFKRLGWDPALMSNPFVAGVIDILGIVIYMNVAYVVLTWLAEKPN